MRAIRMMALVFAVLGASACSSSERYHLDDAVGDFCLPENQKVTDVWWAPNDPPGAPRGFAFAGCDGLRGDEAAQCPFPGSISGGVVEERSAFRSQRWADFGAKSIRKTENLSAIAEKKVFERDGTLIVRSGRQWDVWSHASRSDEQANSLQILDNDVLLASCLAESDPLEGDNTWPAGLKCRRAVLAKDYSLEYSFRSESMSEQALDHLDGVVLSAIDQWRCGSKR